MFRRILHTACAGFEAARQLHAVPREHKTARLHGHSFSARLQCELPANWAPFAGGEVAALGERLQHCVAQLDHRLLNDWLPEPGDAQLARWLMAQLDVPGLLRLGVQAGPRQGVDLDGRGGVLAWRRFRFESAHRLPNVPKGHKCGRMHGHGFEVLLHRDAGPDSDLAQNRLEDLWAPLQEQLHGACLNDIDGLHNPTSEMLSSWIWERLRPFCPELAWVTVFETASCGASFDGTRYRIWKDMTLDSAMMLRRAPPDHPLRRVHGHTYTLRLHLSAPLDEVLGWTLDFGDVKELFNPLFRRLDHQPLHEMAGLADCDCASLAQWIMEQSLPALPAIERVDLYETPGCGAIVWANPVCGAMPL